MHRPTNPGTPTALETFTDLVFEVYRHSGTPAAVVVGLSSTLVMEFSPIPESPRPLVLELEGLVAPDTWDLLSLCYRGEARTSGQRGPGTAVQGVVAVNRQTQVAHRLTRADGSGAPGSDTEAPTGAVVAMLRRALGAPSEAPHGDVVELWNSQWVLRLVEATTDRALGADPRFVDLARLHPAISPGHRVPEHPDGLADRVGRTAAHTHWSELHARARLRPTGGCGVPRRIARWADTAAFALLAQRRIPPLSELLPALAAALEPERMTDVNITLALCDEAAQIAADTSWPDVSDG